MVLEKLLWLALVAVSCVVTYSAQGTSGSIWKCLPPGSRIANALVSWATYLVQFFYPAGLAVFYPYPQDALPIGKIVGSGLLLVGISLAVLAYCRKCPYLLVGWLWYLGMLVPVIGLVQVGAQAMADRYTYLTQIGLAIGLAWELKCVSSGWRYRRPAGGIALALAVMSLMWCAWQQASYWKDGTILWPHALACTSRNSLAHNSLGATLAERGQIGEAMAQFEKVLEIDPEDELAHSNLGIALAVRGELDEAIAHF